MTKYLKIAAITTCITMTHGVYADCTEPDRPQLPDPETAVTPEMVKAKNDVKSYMSAADSYLSCKKMTTRQHNSIVEKMETLASDFNKIVRKFKKKMSS